MRYAKPEDYEEYERFYNDIECETLYRANDEINPQAEKAMEFAMLEEDLKFVEEEDRRTLEKFLADLEKKYVRIYMCIENKRTIGFVQLFKTCGSKWQLEYLCLEPEYQPIDILTEIVEFLHNKANMSQIDVCAFGTYEVFLQNLGFKGLCKGFYRKQKS